MNGPQHFREAERLMRDAGRSAEDGPYYMDDVATTIAAAHVHAALALAAASAQNIRRNGAIDVDACGDWTEVLG